MTAMRLAVLVESPKEPAGVDEQKMRTLARQLALPVVTGLPIKRITDFDAVLHESPRGLALQLTGKGAPGPVMVDFVGGAVAHRRRFGGGKGQGIAKAVGLADSGRRQLHVLDATAGLGRDSFVLASLGCRVTMIERSPVVQALLIDGLRRARVDAEVLEIVQRMTLVSGDAIKLLAAMAQGTEERSDTVYLDPMFPHRCKIGVVKKEMRLFQNLIGGDVDADELLEQAMSIARFRVVVKRPRRAPDLAGRVPNYRLEGKSGRFDVYTLSSIRTGRSARKIWL